MRIKLIIVMVFLLFVSIVIGQLTIKTTDLGFDIIVEENIIPKRLYDCIYVDISKSRTEIDNLILNSVNDYLANWNNIIQKGEVSKLGIIPYEDSLEVCWILNVNISEKNVYMNYTNKSIYDDFLNSKYNFVTEKWESPPQE